MGSRNRCDAPRPWGAPLSRFRHFAAIDWSGAAGARQKGIALAICGWDDGAPQIVRPGHIWSRQDVLDWLRHDLPDDTLVGLDLGPSLPFVDRGAYFPGWTQSPADARALWALVDSIAADDPHLAATGFVDHPEVARHFRRHGGRTGDLFGTGRGRLRVTEEAQRDQGLNPYSNMNLVGAAQVGKSSLTGMRLFHRLAGAIPLWPIDADPGAGSLLVEIYTSIAALAGGRRKGRTKMLSHAALDAALVALGSAPTGGDGPIDDHRSDAILSAAWLRIHAARPDLWHPPGLTARIAATEGWTFGVA